MERRHISTRRRYRGAAAANTTPTTGTASACLTPIGRSPATRDPDLIARRSIRLVPVLDAHDLPTRFAASQVEFYRYLGRSNLVASEDGDAVWVASGLQSSTHNGVAAARFSDSSADDRIRAIVAQFTARSAFLIWLVNAERDVPADLGQRLSRAGLQPVGVLTGMAALLSEVRTTATASRLTIQMVKDETQLTSWDAVHSEVEAERGGYRLALYRSLGLSQESPFRHLLGLIDDEPVATSSVFITGDFASIHNVAVLEPRRRQGIGAAMTTAAVRAAGAVEGFGLLYTSASRALYARMGFTDCTTSLMAFVPST